MAGVVFQDAFNLKASMRILSGVAVPVKRYSTGPK